VGDGRRRVRAGRDGGGQARLAGVEVRSSQGIQEFSPLDAEVVDTTGAGDALAAGFLVGGIELGLETAARCVGQLGAVPA
jgi:sugar/nucleoside kinase (ribokinase family)